MATNKFPKPCTTCGGVVPAGEGRLSKIDGAWAVAHVSCPTVDPTVPAVEAARTVTFTPTAEQFECVKAFATGDNLVIQAGAGAGKTSTLALLGQHADGYGRQGQYTAFNKSIVVDSAGKFPGNVNCATAHSLAFLAVGYQYKDRLNSNRVKSTEIARILHITPLDVEYGEGRKTLAAGFLASLTMKAVFRFCSSADPELTPEHIPFVEAIDPPLADGTRVDDNNRDLRRHLFGAVQAAWADIQKIDGGRLPFKHDHYLKMWQLDSPIIDKDFILFDEAQDADPVMCNIIEQQVARGVQVVAVGDSQQAIYEWRGAVDALARLTAMGGQVRYLTQSFRFGQSVADIANGLLGRIGAELRISGFGAKASTVGPVAEPTCVLCRTNAGAVRTVLRTIKVGLQPHLVGGGGDVVRFARAAQDLMEGRHTQHPELACFDSWGEVQCYVEQDEQGQDLQLLVKLIDEFGVQVIIDALTGGVTEAKADLVVSTAHKSKGREWDSVQLAGDFFKPRGDGDASAAELRLLYVAVTRAKRELDISAVPHAAKAPRR